MADNAFEIPQTFRDVSEQNLKQAQAEYEQLMDLVTKTMAAWTGAIPPNPMATVVKDMQGRAMQIAKENAESVFTFAGKISNALTPQDIVTLQTQFTQDRMQAFAAQTQQLFSVIEEAIQSSERGAMDAGMGAMPSIPMVAVYKDVQDRAVEIAKKNAESESLTAQMQELHKLIGEALQKPHRA
ncbi:MAG: phasin family protein [Rhodomicrobium sp.]